MTQPAAVSGRVDEEAFVSLKDEIAAYVANEGEEWTRRIEEERAVPPELRDELQDRGYLSLAAPEEYGGARDPVLALARAARALLDVARVAADDRPRRQRRLARGRPVRDAPSSASDFVLPAVNGDGVVAFTLTEPTAGTGADLRCSVRREGDTYFLSGEKHLITFGVTLRPLAALRPAWRARRAATAPSRSWSTATARTCRRWTWASRSASAGTDHAHLVFDAHAGPGREPPRRGGRGLEVAFGGFLTPSRIAVAMTCVGLARKRAGARHRARPRARHVRQAAGRAAGDRLRAGRERRRHRGRPPARPPRARASGRRARRTPPCCPRWRS